MKRMTLLIALVLVAATALTAQDENMESEGADRAKEKTERLKNELNLSQEQADQLYAIHSRYSEERKVIHEANRKVIHEANRKEREAQRNQRRSLSEEQREEIRMILTEQQRTRLDALHDERRTRRENRPERPHRRRGRH